MKITREMALEIVLRLANDPDGRVRADAYANILMPQDKLSKVVKNPKAEREEKIAVASNPNTLPEDLDFLTNDSVTWGVKEAVAKIHQHGLKHWKNLQKTSIIVLNKRCSIIQM